MPYMVVATDKPNSEALRAEIRPKHIAYLETNLPKLIAAGAKMSDDGTTAIGSLYLIDTDERAEAERFVAEDPFTTSGVFGGDHCHAMAQGDLRSRQFHTETLNPWEADMQIGADATLDAALKEEFSRNAFNPCVGQILLSTSDRSRVWFIRLEPGERLGFHRHVLDYFWTSLTGGKARSHINGGLAKESEYFAGETKHLSFGKDEFMIHDLENIGSEPLLFVTVEYLQSANAPLPLPSSVRPQGLPIGALLS